MTATALLRRFVILIFAGCLATSSRLYAEPPSPAEPPSTAEPSAQAQVDVEQQVQEHLSAMERRLRLRLLVSDRPAAAVTEAEIERMRRQLHTLESLLRVRARDSEGAVADDTRLIGKVRALRPLVDSLVRAAESPRAMVGVGLRSGPGGAIEGTVTDAATGAPVAGASLDVWTDGGDYVGQAFSDSEGSYQVPGLATGNHFIHTSAQDYLPEVYDGLPCPPSFGCQPWTGTPIPVQLGAVTGDVDVTLDRGGTISGIVTRSMTGDPLADVGVQIWNSDGHEIGTAYTSLSGHYSLSGLYAGTHYATTFSGRYRDELYDDLPCAGGGYGGCDPTTGAPIEVSFGETTGGIDFALQRLGRITGEVTESSGAPAYSVFVDAWSRDGQFAGNGFVFGTGLYEIAGLDAGEYYLTTDSPFHFDELYDDLPCQPDCDLSAGTPVAVNLEATTEGIDFVLDRLGSIAGIVSHRLTGDPLSGVVFVWDGAGNEVAYGFADSGTGSYLADGLVPGTYTASVDVSDYQDELYDDLPCPNGECDKTSGTPIEVSFDTITGGIDFALERLGALSGRITHSVTGEPIDGAAVDVFTPEGDFITFAFGDAAGNYLATGLDPGAYIAIAYAFEHVAEVYREVPCTDDGCDLAPGTPIETQLNTVIGGIDFTLDRLGSISGRVSTAGQPVFDALISIYDSSGAFRRSGYSDAQGNYTVGGIYPDNYFAIASGFRLESELYDGLPCEGGCDPTSGTPIAASLNANTSGIDFDLVYCMPTDTSLCLNGDRFRVEATWESADSSGPGMAEELTADAGTFWFFDPGNIEMVVKVLDVCTEPHNRFWVFGAGLTDVGVELTVTDEATGEVRSYANPLGTPYQPVLDTLAFATCDAGFSTNAASAAAETPASSSPWSPLFQAAPKTVCVPSATSLCLGGGRFLAELVWEAPNGNGGPAPVVQLTDASGYFWFGSADNVEAVVKVLDACNLPPFHNYWVFAAGLTNFEVTLKVTDTESGEVREYFNPQGTTFQAVTDTGAFDTCAASGS